MSGYLQARTDQTEGEGFFLMDLFLFFGVFFFCH